MKGTTRFLKRNRVVVLFALAFMLYVGVTFLRQESKLRQLRAEEAACQQKIVVLKEDVEALEVELENASSPETIERIAREKLKMVKPNEIIYIIQDDNAEADGVVSEVSD
jgi:cell division protein FtsL